MDREGVRMTDTWMPIETAPKDGTWFLAWRPGVGRPVDCMYFVCWRTFNEPLRRGHYHPRSGAGWNLDPAPTHWQPLPPPPVLHASDCAVHNAPALPVGPCDCGAEPPA